MNYLYYPGCSPRTSAKSYDVSARSICKHLDLNLEELKDWNCCGATSYHSVNEIQSIVLSARNLAIAEMNNDNPDLVTICNACFCNLKRTSHTLRQDKKIHDAVNTSLAEMGVEVKNRVKIRHLLDVLVSDLGEEKIRSKVLRPLKGLKAVPYYGCQYSKPGFYSAGTGVKEYKKYNEENDFPVTLDRLLTWSGADVLEYSSKTKCCGALLVTTAEDIALTLIGRLLDAIPESADCIVTMCPLCQFNLEAYQKRINKKFNRGYNIPVLYFTQLLGHSFSLSGAEVGKGSEFISLKKVLAG